jgi:hypothetical protein
MIQYRLGKPACSGANLYHVWLIVAGLSEACQHSVLWTAEVLMAIGGGSGTLSDIAFVLQSHNPIIGLNSWQVVDDISHAHTSQDAIVPAFELLDGNYPRGR